MTDVQGSMHSNDDLDGPAFNEGLRDMYLLHAGAQPFQHGAPQQLPHSRSVRGSTNRDDVPSR